MGVRGLTTFIAANADKYLKTYKLHDTYLVIDGNNIAAHLYTWHTKCNDCFGGDYDKYASTVINFFKLLGECNITPLIIFDGGYEARKLRTIYSRIRNKVRQAQRLNCATEGKLTVFPLFLRELFVEIVTSLQLKAVRCNLEADYEMACIAKKLCCPLLSYDSDFYIFDVLYIPFSSFNMKSTKVKNDKLSITYKAIECNIYRIENFLQSFGGLKTDVIPLLGVLLGNDYIRPSVFKTFYEHIKLQKRRNTESDQQRRIVAVIKWLQNETYESAVRKILGRLKMRNRKYVANQIKAITEGYLCAESKLLQSLGVMTSFDDLDTLQLYIKLDFDSMLSNDVEDESSDSEDNSDSDDSLEPSDFVNNSPKKLPSLFEENYKMCKYPACFIDMIYNQTYFFVPQIESYFTDSSHYISLDILAAIHKILSFCNTYNLTCIIRGENKPLQNLELEPTTKQLPEFIDLCVLTKEKGVEVLFNVLEINIDIVNIVNDFPVSWRLYILSIIYWIQNAKSRIHNCHIYSVILSAIALKLANAYLQVKSENTFLTKFHQEIQCMLQTKQADVSDDVTNLKVALDAITRNDCIMFVREIISNFQMDQKLRKNPKLFNIDIVHSFAELQSCAYHIKYLNTLLNNPFQDYLISEFYNGTSMYNLCANFLNRSHLDTYINTILKYCPNILACFKIIVRLLSPIFSGNIVDNVVLKRKKKKSGGTKIFTENACVHSDDENSLYDVNNKFSVLRFASE